MSPVGTGEEVSSWNSMNHRVSVDGHIGLGRQSQILPKDLIRLSSSGSNRWTPRAPKPKAFIEFYSCVHVRTIVAAY